MIKFTNNGLHIDDTDWYTSNPRAHSVDPKDGGYIAISFHNSIPVILEEEFLRHALSLIDHARSDQKARFKSTKKRVKKCK